MGMGWGYPLCTVVISILSPRGSSIGVSRGCYLLILAREDSTTVFSFVKALNVTGVIILKSL